ncbi:hypothetical protein PIB30_001509 [Stylosanthes scabra]|uniref:Membrane-associated kinase regulator 6 n=1 Tax=Stylosanthes scabra TaxID=79078 RepID=A0ABU6R1N7_9FABA|nr:hypothetical protein [Stylosanthes scabra]
MDPRMPPSKRFFKNYSQDFKFDFPASSQSSSQLSSSLVDADQLFSNGYLVPFFVQSLKMEEYDDDNDDDDEALDSNLPSLNSCSSSSLSTSRAPNSAAAPSSSSSSSVHARCPSLKRCRTLSKRIFQKYLNFLRPLCRKLRGHHNHNKTNSNSNSSKEKVVKRSQSVKNRGFYSEASPRISVAYSADDWRNSCDSESSIYEAVLHCKRSIERRS